ncbi:Fibronectin type III domain-containing protein 5 [Bagarius yarrelli]|uniref:Fibronectin type III domain-containing protein 5 n=1 Tax=Bagarius yarrelli TaxID=175774 RepID=A0A556V518_BAGYA|nr:Fibronectin type III domain-containing protein 5 [Bagarius yarrelli]
MWHSSECAEVPQDHINTDLLQILQHGDGWWLDDRWQLGDSGLSDEAELSEHKKKNVHMLRFIQEVNTTTRSCALWDLEAETDYVVHVQSISTQGTSPPSETLHFRTPKEEEERQTSKNEVTMEEMEQASQLRAGEIIIIVVVLVMWAGVIALFCRQYDIIKDNEPNNNKDKAKNSSECSTPEHPSGGLLRSKV